MAIEVAGFTGTVTEADWSDITSRPGVYTVCGANDLRVSIVSGGADRTVRVAAGAAVGRGIYVASDATTDIQLGSVGTPGASRWDTIVLRRDRGTGEASLIALTGTSALAIAAGRKVAWTDNQDDQPLALARVAYGQSTVAEVRDVRCWASNSGLLVAEAPGREYLTEPGAVVRVVDGPTWRREVSAAGVESWKLEATPVGDSGWVVPVWGGDFGSAGSNLKSRRVGDVVHLTGYLIRSSTMNAGTTTACAILTETHRPTVEQDLGGAVLQVSPSTGVFNNDATGPVVVRIRTTGHVDLTLPRTATRVKLDGLSFRVS